MRTDLTGIAGESQINCDKKCAGNGCTRIGIYPVTIVYINKTGWFCESCKSLIESEGLADKLKPEENSTQMKGAGYSGPTTVPKKNARLEHSLDASHKT